MIDSVTEQIDNSRNSIQATMLDLSTDIKSILRLASILEKIPKGQMQFHSKAEPLTLSAFGPSVPHLKKKRRRQGQNPVDQISSSCKCNPNISFTRTSLLDRWGLGKERKVFIHKRSCPLWYRSQIVTKLNVDVSILERIRIFGSLSINKSPYNSVFGWSISQNLTYKAVVPFTAPAFRVLRRYLMDAGPSICEDCIEGCSRDLQIVFQSGQGSPYDTLTDGTTLIGVCFFPSSLSR